MLVSDIRKEYYVDSNGNLDNSAYSIALQGARNKASRAANAITKSISSYIKAATVTVTSTIPPSSIATAGSPANQLGPVVPVSVSGIGKIS